MHHNVSFHIGEEVAIDKIEFKNSVFQCVFQYLSQFHENADLSSFIYKDSSVEGDYSTCISTLIKCVFIIHVECCMHCSCILIQILHCSSSILG